jgi:NADP-dependent 3-hydroxy acid dehydrogenase YdfG
MLYITPKRIMLSMTNTLFGKVALITGATSGIGQAIAQTFIAAGAHIVAVGRRAERLSLLEHDATDRGVRCLSVVGDVRDPATATTAVEQAIATFGTLDILVNNAGIGRYGPFLDSSLDDYEAMMDTNMRSTYLFTRAAVPQMVTQQAGMILMVASQAGVTGFPNEAIYCATKFAQVGFAEALERELRPQGIRIGVLLPGGVKTEFAIGTGRTVDGVAASEMLEAEDVAAAALLMATMPARGRIMAIHLRPMVEPFYGVEIE